LRRVGKSRAADALQQPVIEDASAALAAGR
jgi:hypothetical protein